MTTTTPPRVLLVYADPPGGAMHYLTAPAVFAEVFGPALCGASPQPVWWSIPHGSDLPTLCNLCIVVAEQIHAEVITLNPPIQVRYFPDDHSNPVDIRMDTEAEPRITEALDSIGYSKGPSDVFD
jgi:hypothetical protein